MGKSKINSTNNNSSTNNNTQTRTSPSLSFQQQQQQKRMYISRAHPQKIIPYPIKDALNILYNEIEERKVLRLNRFERNRDQLMKKAEANYHGGRKYVPGEPYEQFNETIDIALNLNLDPRKPGQGLRGAISLPHGSGKTVRVLVFLPDDDNNDNNNNNNNSNSALVEAVKLAGATEVGGLTLMDSIKDGTFPLSSFDRAFASPDMIPYLGSKGLGRILGPRGLMPNPKVGTVRPIQDIVRAVKESVIGEQIHYKVDKGGIIHAGIGKASFTKDMILDNIRAFMNAIYDVKPEDGFGKAKKKKKGKSSSSSSTAAKGAKYFLKAHLSSTQGKGLLVDLRTIDPTSTFFMDDLPH